MRKYRYYNIKDILDHIQACQEYGVREIVFDWYDIALKGILNHHRLIKMCKRFGKIQRCRQGFIIHPIAIQE